jgi:hypothetical protein
MKHKLYKFINNAGETINLQQQINNYNLNLKI